MDIEKLISFLDFKPVKVTENLCSRKITPKSSCQKCISSCPIQGISFKENIPEVKDCISCGLCVKVCPNHVFKLDEDLLLQVDEEKTNTLIITCPLIQNTVGDKYKNHFSVINCLNQIYPELLLKLLSKFNDVIIFYDPAICKECEPNIIFQPNILAEYSGILEKDLLKLHYIKDKEDIIPYLKTEKDSPAQNRRSFFKYIFTGSKNASKNLFDSALSQLNMETAENKNIKSLPLKRAYLSEGLKNLKNINQKALLPFPNLSIQKCNFCGACSKLCPTGALKITEQKGKKEIAFFPQLCTHCNICYDICIYKGLKWSTKLTIEEFLSTTPQILATAKKRICPECGEDYYDLKEETDLCFLCSTLLYNNTKD